MIDRYSVTMQAPEDGIDYASFDTKAQALKTAIRIKRCGTLSYDIRSLHGYNVEVYDCKTQKTIYSKPVNKK